MIQVTPNPSLHPTRYRRLCLPEHPGEPER